jgi:signal transduction histidine kinase
MAAITRQKGEAYYYATARGFPAGLDDFLKGVPHPPGRGSVVGRTLLTGETTQVSDVLSDPEYTYTEVQQKAGFRTVLGVPLLREGSPIGVLVLARAEVKPFTEKQIELLATFADQAVIAIENVRLFDEIQEKSHQLEEASKHKSQFLANMSHELRTPLNAILGYTELIADGVYGETPEKVQATVQRIITNGRHLLGLINDVLDLSKIEAGQLTLSLADYSMKDVVHSVYGAVEPLAAEKKLNFKAEIAPDMSAGLGDERRLTQVLLNLVGNAIKFTDAGEVVIKASQNDGVFSVAVCDTGPGISETDQSKLFQEFQQADSSTTKKKGGTGLGLAISKKIIEMHGGRIWLESEVGKGSTFAFTVPSRAEHQKRQA